MRHFLGYHNADGMGPRLIDGDAKSLYTKRQECGVGDAVWIVEGSGETPKRYTLASWFVVDAVSPADHGEFTFRLSGSRGGPLSPAPELNGVPWFEEYFRQSAHFSHGLKEVKSADVWDALKSLAALGGRPLP